MLVIAIIMPTIVRDIGGGASTGMVWSRLGARRTYTLGADVFAMGTVCSRWRQTPAR